MVIWFFSTKRSVASSSRIAAAASLKATSFTNENQRQQDVDHNNPPHTQITFFAQIFVILSLDFLCLLKLAQSRSSSNI